jgi:hypothetical protein
VTKLISVGTIQLNIETPAQAMSAADRWEKGSMEWEEGSAERAFGLKVAEDLRSWALLNTELEKMN